MSQEIVRSFDKAQRSYDAALPEDSEVCPNCEGARSFNGALCIACAGDGEVSHENRNQHIEDVKGDAKIDFRDSD